MDAELLDPKLGQQRTTASSCAKIVPVLFVVSIIVGLSSIYVAYHIVPLLSLPHGPQANDDVIADYNRGIVELGVFCGITILLVIAYLKCIFIHPGTVPNESPWRYDAQLSQGQIENLQLQEMKKTGARRHCKWCLKFKPDRCHHCRPLGCCVLKMDHHCPWVHNTIGFRNHKYFVLLVLYSTVDCWFIVSTMLPTIEAAVQVETPSPSLAVVLFAETLAAILGLMVTGFLIFHIWLMLKAMTTIEFCEKQSLRAGYDGSPYDRGVLGNIRAVLGDWTVLWLLPVSPPSGDGMNFRNEEEPLMREIEAGRKMTSRACKTNTKRCDDHCGHGDTSNLDASMAGFSSIGDFDAESVVSGKNQSMRNLHDVRFFQYKAF